MIIKEETFKKRNEKSEFNNFILSVCRKTVQQMDTKINMDSIIKRNYIRKVRIDSFFNIFEARSSLCKNVLG